MTYKMTAWQENEEWVQALEQVIDPELGIDIVNLGLVYDVKVDDEGVCDVDLTLTTIGCPLADVIMEDVQNALMQVSDIKEVRVEFVFYPPWTPDLMTRYAKIALGLPF